jgi:hypothetical protein
MKLRKMPVSNSDISRSCLRVALLRRLLIIDWTRKRLLSGIKTGDAIDGIDLPCAAACPCPVSRSHMRLSHVSENKIVSVRYLNY